MRINIKPMQDALEEARKAGERGEVPVAAALVHYPSGTMAALAVNRCEEDHSPLAHAEMLVIDKVCKETGQARLSDYDLYVTLEPCPMCAGAIAHARIRRLYFGAYDPKSGGVDHGPKVFDHRTCHHRPEIYGGMMEQECSALLKEFFADLRVP
jgi:tRNA(Arg) A34 adenosine deaminase TadA